MSSDIPSNLGQQPNSALFTKQLGIDRQPLMIAPETLLQEVIAQMNRASDTCTVDPDEENAQPDGRRSYALVTYQQKLMGIVTERDMVKLTAEGICFTTTSVEQVMTSNVITLKESDIKDAFTPLNLLRRYRIRHLPVVDGQNNICGVITSARLRERLPASALLKRRQVQEVMATHIITATPTTPVID
ncbi:MAG: CBS domain-containing protein, partial [Cyanobacteria bacterium J06560_2]